MHPFHLKNSYFTKVKHNCGQMTIFPTEGAALSYCPVSLLAQRSRVSHVVYFPVLSPLNFCNISFYVETVIVSVYHSRWSLRVMKP